ncbi:MAG: Hsp20/alpha crystallin family protein [Verrucomicrobia bacterium]|nr:Hsp20/alpha crystallin family protein [Verrucomicrobiota bacterium]
MKAIVGWRRPEMAGWTGFGRLNQLEQELGRLFGTPLAAGQSAGMGMPAWAPAMDVQEDKDSVVVQVELPGMKREEIQVSLEDGTLTISGERKMEKPVEGVSVHHTERSYGLFERSVTLPTMVAADKVNAQYADGMLTVTLPKADEVKPRQISVKVG